MDMTDGRAPAARPRGLPARLRAALGRRVPTEITEAQLGQVLALVAGAVNAGGFLLVGQYTSHMSGVVSAMADNLALGAAWLVLAGLGALLAFMAGAACSAILINWGRRRRRRDRFAMPLLLEAALLVLFGLLAELLAAPASTVLAVPVLCFLMGLQNATITKVSGARVRTTHMTGIVTDIGIELGKLFYWNRMPGVPEGDRVLADRAKLRLLGRMLGCFFAGGVIGALGFGRLGYAFSVPVAVILLVLAGAMVRQRA